MQKGGYVYIVTNKPHGTLYILTHLVYFERFENIRAAIAREKQLKRWRREKKVWLIEQENPRWNDLSAGWFDDEL